MNPSLFQGRAKGFFLFSLAPPYFPPSELYLFISLWHAAKTFVCRGGLSQLKCLLLGPQSEKALRHPPRKQFPFMEQELRFCSDFHSTFCSAVQKFFCQRL